MEGDMDALYRTHRRGEIHGEYVGATDHDGRFRGIDGALVDRAAAKHPARLDHATPASLNPLGNS